MARLWCFSDDDGGSLLCQGEGRWHKARGSVVVLESTPLAAICSHLVLADVRHPRELPPGYRLMEVTVEDAYIEETVLPQNWSVELTATQVVGGAWLAAGQAPILRVPALTGAAQYLFNTRHRLASFCQVRPLSDDAIAKYTGNLDHAVLTGTDWLAVLPALAEPPVGSLIPQAALPAVHGAR